MKLTPRLKAIADWIQPGQKVGDVGSDHGYLMTYLVDQEIIKWGVASDINEGPVLNCKKTVASYGFEDQIDIRLGGGLLPYKMNEIESVVIAGMGGELIRDILIESDPIARKISHLYLQPMTGQDVLREWLLDHGYEIVKEKTVWEDNRCYEILHVRPGEMDLRAQNPIEEKVLEDDLYFEVGLRMVHDQAYADFIDKKINKYVHILRSIEKNGDTTSAAYLKAKKRFDLLNEVKVCIQTQVKL